MTNPTQKTMTLKKKRKVEEAADAKPTTKSVSPGGCVAACAMAMDPNMVGHGDSSRFAGLVMTEGEVSANSEGFLGVVFTQRMSKKAWSVVPVFAARFEVAHERQLRSTDSGRSA